MGVTFALFTVIGLGVFVIIPAAIFYSLEDWTYGEALYCCFITILTIGYADFVPGKFICRILRMQVVYVVELY